MKIKFLKIFALVVLALTVVLCAVSCGDDETSSSSTAPSETSTSVSTSTAPSETSTQEPTETETSTSGGEETPEQPKPIDKTVVQLELNYDMAYMGNSLKDVSMLFDEQELDPMKNKFSFPISFVPLYDYDNNRVIDDADENAEYVITIDFDVKKHIDCIYLFYKGTGQEIKLETGTAFNYENVINHTVEKQGWNIIPVNADTRYLNITFKNGKAPYEIYTYGYDLGEEPEVPTTIHQNKTMGYLIGMNGHSHSRNNQVSVLKSVGYYRDYKTWTFIYNRSAFPAAGTKFSGDYLSNLYAKYKSLQGITDCVTCFMFDTSNNAPFADGSDKNDPESYMMYAEAMYQYTLRFGNNPANTKDLVVASGPKVINMNLINWVELGNEPNGEDSTGFTPYQLAALTSMAYDGHCNTYTKSPSGSGVGVKNADPNVKVAMAGLAGIQTRYVKTMAFWLEHNRTDGTLGMEAFNIHTYCRKQISYNGHFVEVGVSPESGDLAGSLKGIIDFRNNKYPEMEVWLTEFGWDTNQSYSTEGSAHAYGPFTGRQVQAMWLTRAYLILSSIGVDRAAMYMYDDVGSEDSVGKYGTSGIVTNRGEKKDSFYYIYTLKENMNDMYFVEEIESGNEDVWIYKYENGSGKTCYAVWCPTTDDVRVENFKLDIEGSTKATLVEMMYGETAGVKTELSVDNGNVYVNVSECPILVICE